MELHAYLGPWRDYPGIQLSRRKWPCSMYIKTLGIPPISMSNDSRKISYTCAYYVTLTMNTRPQKPWQSLHHDLHRKFWSKNSSWDNTSVKSSFTYYSDLAERKRNRIQDFLLLCILLSNVCPTSFPYFQKQVLNDIQVYIFQRMLIFSHMAFGFVIIYAKDD